MKPTATPPKPFGARAPASGTANAAEPDDDELDGVWAVTDVDDMLTEACDEVLGFYGAASLVEEPVGGDTVALPGLVELPDEDFLVKLTGTVTYLDANEMIDVLPQVETTELCKVCVNADVEATLDYGLANAVIATVEQFDPVGSGHIKLYDSRSTCHLLLYCANFQNFEELPA